MLKRHFSESDSRLPLQILFFLYKDFWYFFMNDDDLSEILLEEKCKEERLRRKLCERLLELPI